MRELWARALYGLESFRTPLRWAEMVFWAVLLALYLVLQSAASGQASGLRTSFAEGVRNALAFALVLSLALGMAHRVPLRSAAAWLLHGGVGVVAGAIASVVAHGAAADPPRLTRLAGAIALYWLFVTVRAAYATLRGPETPETVQLALDLVRAPGRTTPHRERFVVRRRGREIVVPAREVNWIQAAGHEVVLHLGAASYPLRESMQAVERSLDPGSFVRVHRSRIVNLDRIRAIYPWAYGDFRILMQDGTIVNFSRRYRGRVEELLG